MLHPKSARKYRFSKLLFPRFVAIAVCAALMCGTVWAQSTAQIQGVVQDPSASPIPAAIVKVTQIETGAVRTATSGQDGVYVLTNLPIGPYRLEVSHEG